MEIVKRYKQIGILKEPAQNLVQFVDSEEGRFTRPTSCHEIIALNYTVLFW